MSMIQSVLQHPLAFAAGLALLLSGVWLLRKSGLLFLLGLAVAAAVALAGDLTGNGWLPDKLLYHGIIYAVFVVAAVLASRHPVIAADAELIVVLILCFAAGPEMADRLHWPPAVVWCLAVAGTVIAPPLAVAVFSAAILSFALGLATPWATVPLFFLCLLLLRVQYSRWTRMYWDPRLATELGPRGLTGLSMKGASDDSLQVFFSNKKRSKQRMLIDLLKRRGICVEEYPGGTAGANIPARLVRGWRRPWGRLFELQPDYAFANRAICVPPIKASDRQGTDLAEIASRLRSHDGKSLAPTVATGEGVTVAVLDTGVNPATNALKAAIIDRVSCVSHEPDPSDFNSHGTAVASCTVAVASHAKLISVKVLDENGAGTLLNVLRGLTYVAQNRNRIHLLNLSLGAPGGDPGCPLCRALQALAADGVASCTAIGNSGMDGAGSIQCPGASPGTLGVGAVDLEGRVARFSSRGPSKDPHVPKPDLCCFGVDLRMPDRDGRPWVASGTSFAAPFVTGVVAGALEITKHNKGIFELYQLVRGSCTPAAFGHRDPNSAGAGIANLARIGESQGARAVLRTLGRPFRIRKSVSRVAGLASALALLIMVWWFGVDHVGTVTPSQAASRRIILLGRVLKASDEDALLIDDGSGAALLDWRGPAGTKPDPGGVFLVRASGAQIIGGRLVIEGQSRLALGIESESR